MNVRFNFIAAFSLIFGLLLATGCSKPADNLIGDWKVDVESLKNDPRMKKLEGDKLKQAMKMATEAAGKMTFTFTKDGKFKMAMGPMTQEGTYAITKTDGNTLTIETKMKKGDKEKTETVTATIDGSKLKLNMGGKAEALNLVKQ